RRALTLRARPLMHRRSSSRREMKRDRRSRCARSVTVAVGSRPPMPLAILMPVYNDPVSLERTLGKVRDRASLLGGVTVFLVDDGSQPSVDPAQLPAPTPLFRIVLARHAVNLGQGAALETARQLALREARFRAYVTMDAD